VFWRMAKEDQILEMLSDIQRDMGIFHEKLTVIEKWMLSKASECKEHQERTIALEKTAVAAKATADALSGQTAKIIGLTTVICTLLTLVLKVAHII